jgi:phthalate 4,5-cis-dihydrodiol dehydrogenase
MLPTFVADARITLVAAADPLAAARTQFAREFGAPAYAEIDELCADPAVEIIYLATPHQLHARHAQLAFAHGKHVLVEKPMAITLAECTAMIDAAAQAARCLVVGHSHSFNRPIARTRELIASGTFGAVRMISAMYATDFLYRPRRPEELRTAEGGGVIFSQAAHQIDIVRLLGGGRVRCVRAMTSAWDRQRATEGAYGALLTFDDGVFATVTYSGYGHFDGDELMDGIGEMGRRKSASDYGAARRRLRDQQDPKAETALKAARNYGGSAYVAPVAESAPAHQHFGFVLVCCERGDLRPLPTGVVTYDDNERRIETIPAPVVPRVEVIDELWSAVVDARPPVHSGEWSRATLEVCLAILASAERGSDITLQHQVAMRD